jgi:hypothetical protein
MRFSHQIKPFELADVIRSVRPVHDCVAGIKTAVAAMRAVVRAEHDNNDIRKPSAAMRSRLGVEISDQKQPGSEKPRSSQG